MKRYVAIDLLAVKKLGLTLESWVLLENIYFMSNNDYKACYASKDTLRDTIGVSNGQIYKIIAKLTEDGYISKTDLGHLRVTQKWMDISSGKALQKMENERGDTLQKMENSLQKMEKHPPKNGDKEREIREKEERKKINKKKFSFSLAKSFSYKALDEEYIKKLEIYAFLKDCAYQFQKFKDHHIAKGSKFQDWSRAYSTWLNNSVKFDNYSLEDHKPKRTSMTISLNGSPTLVQGFDCISCFITDDGKRYDKVTNKEPTPEEIMEGFTNAS